MISDPPRLGATTNGINSTSSLKRLQQPKSAEKALTSNNFYAKPILIQNAQLQGDQDLDQVGSGLHPRSATKTR